MCSTKFCFKPIKIIRFIYFCYFCLQTLIVTLESRFVTHSIVWTGRVISTQYPHWRAPHWQMEPVITSAQRYTDNGAELIKGEGRKGVVGGCVVGWTHYFLTIPSPPCCTFLLSFLMATLTPTVFSSQWVFAEQLIATLSFESFFLVFIFSEF